MLIGIDACSLVHQKTGVAYYIYHLIRHLVQIAPYYQFRLLLFDRNVGQNRFMELATGNVEVRPCYSVGSARGLYGMLKLSCQRILTIERFVGSVDLFHSTDGLCLAQKKGKRIVTIFDLSPILFPRYHPLRRVMVYKVLLAYSARRADRVIVISENTKRDVMRHLDIPEEKIAVTPLAAGAAFRPIREAHVRLVLQRHGLIYRHYWLCVGAMEPRKNLVHLVTAYELLRRRVPISMPLVLVGGTGWRNREIHRKIVASSWCQDIRLLGYVPEEELAALYGGAFAFLYPSLYEGFGLPPLEAMACGTPVITSNVSSLPEVVSDAAIMVEPYDVDKLAETMYEVLNDEELRQKMSKKGLERAKMFSWEKTTSRTLQVYEEILSDDR